ncbi:MAG TPA: MauE/DoxX family redox-associated membrane protein [Vicinamibacterales bacterium]|nr:MauE/DoxX family redox-associated membrane protein [Vicinamibacterales bacterium]
MMAPLVVQIVSTLLARWFVGWRDAARIGLAAMFLFTAGFHFSGLKHDLAAMIPPPLTGALWVIYLTGVLEAAGAIGLLTPRLRRAAAWGLLALLVALFPANVYAALTGATLGGDAATPLWFRAPLQVFWGAVLWQTSLTARSEPAVE